MHDYQDDIDAVTAIPAVRTILDVCCQVTGMGFSAVARVTEDRWIVCAVRDTIEFGLKPGGELKVETTICDQIRKSHEGVAIDEVSRSAIYYGHPTPAMYGFESYISMPIFLPNGEFFGTLCAIDPRPAKVETPEIVNMFKLFAELIAFHIDAHQKLARSEATLDTERSGSELREQFIAVLGHDLRNPLASIDAGARMLGRQGDLNPKSREILGLMQSTVLRMSKLVDNVLDFARGRLGGGVPLNRERGRPVADTLEQVLQETRSASPERVINSRIDAPAGVDVDHARLAQLFSNLLGNAVHHGAPDQPIVVEAKTADGEFVLAVANGGEPIPAATLERLFQPFYRGKTGGGQGLGLGLFIASEIALAHGGLISVNSNADETRFTFRMPL